ncbi:MAG: DUF4112 domain-containing protein [Caulobacteraceae bacterium]|nr:DUF4112 domain-containing protein [Caulobacteraceae bacterium]
MNRARSAEDVAGLRRAIARISRLSDSLIRIGPFGIGLDGLLAWVPAIGTIYSLAAGGYLLVQGYRARVPATVLAQAAGLIGLRTVVTLMGETIILPAEIAVDFFRAHKWSADLMVKAIDRTLYVDGPDDPSNPNHLAVRARKASGEERRRVVFLG